MPRRSSSRSPARDRLGVNVGATAAIRVLVTGDSISLPIAVGLGSHGAIHGDLVVDWAGQIGWPILHANQMYAWIEGRALPVARCKSFPTLWKQYLRAFRPDVVLVVSSLTNAIDTFRKAGVAVL